MFYFLLVISVSDSIKVLSGKIKISIDTFLLLIKKWKFVLNVIWSFKLIKILWTLMISLQEGTYQLHENDVYNILLQNQLIKYSNSCLKLKYDWLRPNWFLKVFKKHRWLTLSKTDLDH